MKTRIWIALLTLYLAWGSTYLAIHYAVQSIPPFLMSGVRFLVAGLILFIWRRFAGDPAPTRENWRSAAIIGSLLLVGGIGVLTWVEQYVPSGMAALIIAATPLWVVLLGTIRRGGSLPTRLTAVGVLMGLVGIFILINPLKSTNQPQDTNLWMEGILLLAALSWAVGSVYSHEANLPKSALLSTGMELLAGSAGAFLLGLVTGETSRIEVSSITLNSLAGLVYLTIVGSLVGFVCYTWLLQAAPTTLVVTYAYVNPLVALILGSLLVKETLTTQVLIATPLILLAVILLHARQPSVKTDTEQRRLLQQPVGED